MSDNAEREDATSSVSRGSSINGPYQAKAENTFPRAHLVHAIIGAEETYSRSLLSSGHGFAFWDIDGSHVRGPSSTEQQDPAQRQGISIGDIGMIDPQGQFVFLFNIFTPATHPLHQGHVPEDFEEFRPPLNWESDVDVKPDYFKTGSIIASKGVNITRISEEPLKFSMSSTAREGAILVLPHGGSREDLKSTSFLTEYVKRHALDWYQHTCQHARSSAKTIPNGSLYLITGCDRAKSWSAMAFPSNWKDAGKQIEMTYAGEEFPCWLPSRWAREKTLPLAEGEGMSYCVFARGIHISLSDRLWVRHLPYKPREQASYYNILAAPVLGFGSQLARLRERFMRDSDFIWDGHQKFPFHPSVLISQALLDQHPTADVAIVEDSVWLILAKEGNGTLSEVLDWVVRALMSSELVKLNGLVGLVPRTSELAPRKVGFIVGFLAKYADWRARSRLLSQVKRIMRSN